MKNGIYLLLLVAAFAASNISAQCNGYNVPYYQGFSSITANNQLPTCWAISNPTTCQTFTSTNGNYGAFYYSPGGVSYFYSPGFTLKAGVIYSVACFYMVSPSNNNGWTNLSILLGVSQSSTGLQTLVSNSSPNAINYSPLTGTFTVINSGNYHLAIAATNNGAGTSPYLLWDDFTLQAPCSLNSPSISVVATPSDVCEGDTLTIVASGADTYSWCGGSTASSVQVIASPTLAMMWQSCLGGNAITGIDTASGCTNGLTSIPVNIYPKPIVNSFANPVSVCRGKSSNLQAFGALSYTWNIGASTNVVAVTPSVTTQYSVTGVNQYGCWGGSAVNVTVHPAPTLTVADLPVIWCLNWPYTVTASGASSYTWTFGSQINFSNPLTFQVPNDMGIITVTGSDANSCIGTFSAQIVTGFCLGVEEGFQNHSRVYPNPFSESFYLETAFLNSNLKLLNDMGAEQPVRVEKAGADKFLIDIRHLLDGIYILKVDDKCVRILKDSR